MGEWAKDIGAITLFVEDPQHSKSFYQKFFDLQPLMDSETDAMFRLENTMLFLTKSSERNCRTLRAEKDKSEGVVVSGIQARSMNRPWPAPTGRRPPIRPVTWWARAGPA